MLLIHNMQESDYGQYMCYARNSMGSVQRTVEIADTDSRDKKNYNDKRVDVKDWLVEEA